MRTTSGGSFAPSRDLVDVAFAIVRARRVPLVLVAVDVDHHAIANIAASRVKQVYRIAFTNFDGESGQTGQAVFSMAHVPTPDSIEAVFEASKRA